MVILGDVEGSSMLPMASPDSFTSVTCAQCDPAHGEQGVSGRLANSGVLWQMQIELHSAWQWTHVPLQDIGPWWSLTVWSETCIPVACRSSFVGQRSRYLSGCWVFASLLSLSISSMLLRLCWETKQISLWHHIWMYHPGGADWVASYN